MGWSKQLDKKNGSRPRCILLIDGDKGVVADRLTRLVGLEDAVVTPVDNWMPRGKPVKRKDGSWNTAPAKEVQLGGLTKLLSNMYGDKRSKELKQQLNAWWNPKRGKTPTWDIASTCRIKGRSGLLLVEAKAHKSEELSGSEKSNSKNEENLKSIACAIDEATAGLANLTSNSWSLSRDHHYQLSNRFAWSWKLVSLGIPVVLLYLGFLRAEDMAKEGRQTFRSKADWERVLRSHCCGVVDNSCWDRVWCVNGVPMFPIIRVFDQPFSPSQD